MVASAYGTRPSGIVGIRNRRHAYDFDLAVLTQALKERPKQYPAQLVQPAQAAQAAQPQGATKGFADLSPYARRIKIPESGIW